jgi:acyl-CoA synthetase (AMP-forming)/AMP-acid ligase II
LGDCTGFRSIVGQLRSLSPDAVKKLQASNHAPDLSALRLILVESTAPGVRVHGAFLSAMATVFSNFGLKDGPRGCLISPVCTIAEHGGIVIAQRDDDVATPLEVFVDASDLQTNALTILNDSEIGKKKAVKLVDSGLIGLETMCAIVEPDSRILAFENTVGEIWIQSDGLPIGFYGLDEHTRFTFDATLASATGNGSGMDLDHGYFLRTGLLGFLYQKRLFVIGILGERMAYVGPSGQVRYYYTPDIANTIYDKIKGVDTW